MTEIAPDLITPKLIAIYKELGLPDSKRFGEFNRRAEQLLRNYLGATLLGIIPDEPVEAKDD